MKKLLSAMVVLAMIVMVSACSRPPWEWTGCYYQDSACAEMSHDTMTQVVDALNSQDAAALKEVFTPRARMDYWAEIDAGVAYLLSLFPDGDVVWLDPEAEPLVGPWHNQHGTHAVWVSSYYRVASGGEEYQLFFEGWSENEIDPNLAGVSGMGAVPAANENDPRNTNLDAAIRSWQVALDDTGQPSIFMMDDGASSPDRAAQIVDALNRQDAAALHNMVMPGAAPAIDPRLPDLLAQFPHGDIVIHPDPGRAIISERYYGDTRTLVLLSFYRVTSAGVDYRLFFAEYLENIADPGDVGIYAIGAVPMGSQVNEGPEAYMYDWTSLFDFTGVALPGVYNPANERR